MPPTNDNSTVNSQAPGSDVLLDTLRRSKISDTQRQQMWDAYQTQGDEKAFTGALNKLSIGDDAKQTLYDMRFKGFKNPATKGPEAQQAPATSTPQAKQAEPFSIGRRDPSTLDKLGDVFAPLMEHLKFGGAAKDPRLVAPEALIGGPLAQSKHPIGTAVGEVAGSLTTADNIAIMGATGGLGTIEGMAGKVAPRLISAGFSAQMIKGAYDRYQPFKEAMDRGDIDGALYHFTHGVLGVAMAAQSGQHAAAGDVTTSTAPKEKVTADSTPMGPRDSGSQQLHVQFAANAPAEARAPQAGQFRGAEGPMRPWDPTGTRFAKGGTVGLDAVSASFKPEDIIAPQVRPEEINKDARVADVIGPDMSANGKPQQGGIKPEPKPEQALAPIMSDKVAALSAVKATNEQLISTFTTDKERLEASRRNASPQEKLLIDNRLNDIQDNLASLGVPIVEKFQEREGPLTGGAKVPSAPVRKSIEMPEQLSQNIETMTELGHHADLAVSDAQHEQLLKQRSDMEAASRGITRQHLDSLTGEQLLQFRDDAHERGSKLQAQADAIESLTNETIKNRGINKDLTEIRAQGGPPRRIEVSPGQFETVKQTTKIGPAAAAVIDDARGKVPRRQVGDLELYPRPDGVSADEWNTYIDKELANRKDLVKQISDTISIAHETQSPLDADTMETLSEQLKDLDNRLGKYATLSKQPGRVPSLTPELDEKGAIKAPEQIKSWTLDRARLALGTGRITKSMPTDEEFFQEANKRRDKAQLLHSIGDMADEALKNRNKTLVGQRGGIGELTGSLRGQVKVVSLADRVPSADELVKRAQAAKFDAWDVSDDKPAGFAGWLSPDGKQWIDKGNFDHADVADRLMPDLMTKGDTQRAMLDAGWLRKVSYREYESWKLSPKNINAMEMSTIRDGKHGWDLLIDTQGPRGIRALHIDKGWTDLEPAIRAAKREQGFTPESGKIPGIQPLAGSVAGAVAGATIGAHWGGPTGAIIGGAIGWAGGFITPAIAQSRPMWNMLNRMRPAIASYGIPLRDWLMGPSQSEPVNRDMIPILDKQQRDLQGPTKSLLQRVAQFPGDVQSKIFDKFIFINDRPGAMINFLMKFDQRGAAFRDLRGKLDVENSPYVSAWLAAGGGGGMAEAHLVDYKRMYSAAQKAGLVNNLNEYLNLKGYDRVYKVMQERIQEADQSINQLSQALNHPNLSMEQKVDLGRKLRATKTERQEVIDRLTSGDLVPAPYDPPKIAADLGNLQQTLGPQKFQRVQVLADQVFNLNRKVLDMVRDSGIIGDAEYNKYVGRGNEYIPMHRILEQVADNTRRVSGQSSPLYLRQQNVIKALMGSDKINRDPIVASADANLEAMREVMRNGVIKDYLKIAAADPQGVGSYFKKVPSGYKVGPDEGLVGLYDKGSTHTFATPKWLSESLKNVSPVAADVIGSGPLKYFGQLLRKGATAGNLAWSLPNALRHLGDMAIMSNAGLKSFNVPRDVSGLLRDWTKSVYDAATKSPQWQEYMRSGAAYSTLQRQISPETNLSLDAIGFKQKVAKARLVEVVQDFNAAVEDTTKMTTFQRLRQSGLSEKAAAWETRRYGGGPDFARQGNLTPAINMASMFFNAHLQYVTRVFQRAAEQPARIGAALGAITMMAMTLNEYNFQQKDDKGNPLMRKVLRTDRENNFVVLTGNTDKFGQPLYFKIPKPSFVKFLYNPIENMLNKVSGQEERTGTELGLQAISNLVPGQMDLKQGQLAQSAARGVVSSANPIIRAPLEEAMNYQTQGGGRPIVPSREDKIDPRFQYGMGTSQVAKNMGQGGVLGAETGAATGATIGYLVEGAPGAAVGGALGGAIGSVGFSPRRIDHVIQGVTSGVGQIGTGFVDPFLTGVKRTQISKGGFDEVQQTPLVGPIARRFTSTGIDQEEQTQTQKFYDNAQKASQPLATLKFLEKNHPDQISNYIQAHKDELWRGKMADSMVKRLSDINNAQRMVEQNPDINDETRVRVLKNIKDVKLSILKTFNKVIGEKPLGQTGQPGSPTSTALRP